VLSERELELAAFAAWLERRQANRDYRASYFGPHARSVSKAEEASRWEYMNTAWRAWCVACDELGEYA
jgi:hypothetical protein